MADDIPVNMKKIVGFFDVSMVIECNKSTEITTSKMLPKKS